jgi:DNA-binding transcriptional ArsR family regulator
MDARSVATVAAALASDTRATIVCALMGGTAHTTTELARHTGVAPSTASEHVGRLVDAGLVIVHAQGRHRYVRLAGPAVAGVVEALASVPLPPAGRAPLPRVPAGLAFARSCYDHLAGELGVGLCDRLTGGGDRVTPDGAAVLARLGVDDDGHPVRTCLDWSQRRPHLGGPLGRTLLARLLEDRWFTRHPTRPRELRLTARGRAGLLTEIGVRLDAA